MHGNEGQRQCGILKSCSKAWGTGEREICERREGWQQQQQWVEEQGQRKKSVKAKFKKAPLNIPNVGLSMWASYYQKQVQVDKAASY